MRRTRLTLTAVLVVLGCGISSGVRAQAEQLGEGSGLSVEVGLMAKGYRMGQGSADVFAVSPLFSPRFAITEQLAIAVQWGFAFDSISGNGDSSTAFFAGNPRAAVEFVATLGPVRLRVDGGLTFPLSMATDDRDQVFASAFGGGMRGLWDLWLWSLEALSLMTRSRAELNLMALFLAADFGVGVIFPVTDTHRRDAQVVVQFAGEIGFAVGPVIPGLRFQGVGVTETRDGFQAALVPFVRVDLGRSRLFARLTINLDNPAGFSFSDEGIYGVLFGAAVTL